MAGGEDGAGAGEEHDAGVRVPLGAAEGVDEVGLHLEVDGVAFLGPVEGDAGDAGEVCGDGFVVGGVWGGEGRV